jgi:hypothetical protein
MWRTGWAGPLAPSLYGFSLWFLVFSSFLRFFRFLFVSFRFLLVLLISKFVQICFFPDLKNVHIRNLFKFEICSNLKFV